MGRSRYGFGYGNELGKVHLGSLLNPSPPIGDYITFEGESEYLTFEEELEYITFEEE